MMVRLTQLKKTWDETEGYCSNLSLGGFDDWRVPSKDELSTLVDYSKSNPTIDSSFVNIKSYYYWSSTTYANFTDRAWNVDFSNGNTYYYGKTLGLSVRCVRGGQFGTFDTLSSLKKVGFSRDATKEIVHDSKSGLMWQDNVEVKTVTKTWDESQGYCSNLTLGGFDDWSVPSIHELKTLTDFSKFNPAINEIFVNITSNRYWSSTTYANDTDAAWVVYFYSGHTNNNYKTYSHYVRCVRGGQSDSFVNLLFKKVK